MKIYDINLLYIISYLFRSVLWPSSGWFNKKIIKYNKQPCCVSAVLYVLYNITVLLCLYTYVGAVMIVATKTCR